MTRTVPGRRAALPGGRLVVLGAEGLILVLASLAVIVGVESGAYPELDPVSAVILFIGLWLYWFLGLLIVVRVDGHRVGWLFTVAASMLAATFALWSLAAILSHASPGFGAAWLYATGALLFTPALILAVPAVAMVFPTGGLPGRRWRWAVALVVGLLVLETLAVLLGFTLSDDQEGVPTSTTLPMEIVAPLVRIAIAVGALAVPVAAMVGLAAIVVRFRRSSGVQRQQLKWFVAAIVPAAVLLPLGMTDTGTSVIGLLSVLTFPLAALAIAVSILRYRLYDIDRIISRTIAYLVVTAMLVGVVGMTILVLQSIISGAVAGPGSELDPLVVAASTLVVAALFNPLRRRVQAIVDRRFHRARYDAERTVATFAGRLRDQLDLPTLTGELRRATVEAVEPATTAVWLRASGGSR